MAYGTVYITTQGAILAAKTLESKKLKFSRFTVGDGEIIDCSVENIKKMTKLINSVKDFNITKISRDTKTQVTIRGLFQNTDVENAFYFRELGLYAIDPDTKEETLFAYVNYGNEAEYINNSIAEKKEHYYKLIITVDNAENVEININSNTIYITEKELKEEINDLKSIVVAPNAGAHNAIYRGKDITNKFNDGTLSQQIAAGTFDDIFTGDYIIGQTSGRKYLVADINYRLHTGDTECTTPHLLMIPEQIMGTEQMNSTNTTEGAYTGSEMYITNLEKYREIIRKDFGKNHILKHREFFTNAVEYGHEISASWYESDIDLMNEIMIYGSNIFHNILNTYTMYMNTTIDKSQLAIFKFRKDLIIGFDNNGSRKEFWTRDVASDSVFAVVSGSGYADNNVASASLGIRPAFLIY